MSSDVARLVATLTLVWTVGCKENGERSAHRSAVASSRSDASVASDASKEPVSPVPPAPLLFIHSFGGPPPLIDVTTTVQIAGEVRVVGKLGKRCQDGGWEVDVTSKLSTAARAKLDELLAHPDILSLPIDTSPPDPRRVYWTQAPRWDGAAIDIVIGGERGPRSALFDGTKPKGTMWELLVWARDREREVADACTRDR